MMVAGAALGQSTLASDAIELIVLPGVGARLHRLRVFGHDLLRTPADPREHVRDPFFWGAYNMAPWCNRIDSGPLRVGRRTVDLAANFRDGSVIHGQVFKQPWEQVQQGELRVRGGGDGWPWPYEARLGLKVGRARLEIEQRVVNLADEPMPAGVGLHPWFRPRAQVAIHADAVYPTNTNSPALPVPVSGAFDLRRGAEMTSGLDATWAGLGDPAVELWWPDINLRATLRVIAPTVHVTAASPADVDALAIEPQTHAPQGLRRLVNGEPGALAWLAPGGELRQVIEMSFETGDPDRLDGGMTA